MEKLIAIQNELKVPKGNFNAFGKYKYRSAEDILEAVKPVLLKHKASLTLTDSIIAIGSKFFLQSTAILNIEGCDPIIVNGFAETSEHKGMSSEQATGTASSYARKYALNGLFLIDETEADPDNGNVKAKENTITDYALTLNQCKSLEELRVAFDLLPGAVKIQQEAHKNKLKLKLTNNK